MQSEDFFEIPKPTNYFSQFIRHVRPVGAQVVIANRTNLKSRGMIETGELKVTPRLSGVKYGGIKR
jgi:hypothetical protein